MDEVDTLSVANVAEVEYEVVLGNIERATDEGRSVGNSVLHIGKFGLEVKRHGSGSVK